MKYPERDLGELGDHANSYDAEIERLREELAAVLSDWNVPGPWYVVGKEGNCIIISTRSVVSSSEWTYVSDADAILIAAAPELLSALEEICDSLGECGMTERARNAIAKALGLQPNAALSGARQENPE